MSLKGVALVALFQFMSLLFVPWLADPRLLCIVLHIFNINSLAPGKFELNFRYLIFQIISVIDGWVIYCELVLRRMSLELTDDKSTLVQVMAWCRQATSHYLSQCWPRSLSPYGVTRPQWVNFKLVIVSPCIWGGCTGVRYENLKSELRR